MDDHDRQLLEQLSSGDESLRLAAARGALIDGRTDAAERSHPLLYALPGHLKLVRYKWPERFGHPVALLLVGFAGYFITLPLLARVSMPIGGLAAAGFWAYISYLICGKLGERQYGDSRLRIDDVLASEAHSLAAINGLAPLLIGNDAMVQDATVKSLYPVLPHLDLELASCLPNETVQKLALATGDRHLSARFRIELLKALARMADYRAAAGVASALREGKWDAAIRDAASEALESIQANKRNNSLLRPVEQADSDTLLRPAANTKADSESLLRPTLNTPNGG